MVDKFQFAIECFEKEDFDTAQKTLKSLLSKNKDDYDVLNFLGTIQLIVGNYEKSIEYFKKVIKLLPSHPNALYNLGLAYQQINMFEEAEVYYKKLLLVNDFHPDALNNLGLIYFHTNKFTEAESCYNDVLKYQPDNVSAINNLANLYLKLSKYNLAIENYLRAIKVQNNNEDLFYNLGTCYLSTGQNEKAIECFSKALEIKPGHIDALNNLGVAYTNIRDYDNAASAYKKIIELDEKNSTAYFNLGRSKGKTGDVENAIEYLKNSYSLNTENKNALLELGNIYYKMNDLANANHYFDLAAGNNESRPYVFNGLGLVALSKCKVDEALDYFDLAIQSDPERPETHYNKAHALLLKGNYEEGWAEYEWRLKRKDVPVPEFTKPSLIGNDPKGKTVLVYAEQGLGDTINFVRYLKTLKSKAGKIIFVCDKSLIPIFKQLDFIDEIYPGEKFDDATGNYDYQIALMSLPFYFKTNRSNIPCDIPYIKPQPELIEDWENILGKKSMPRVGLVWAGNPKNTRDKIRSCSLKYFQTLFTIPDIEFISLQKGIAVKELEENKYPVKNYSSYLNSFADTAALIHHLDLVVTVDTSVAHLAGAMGKEVWTLISFLPDWRWLLNVSDTAWYPTMKLFRQKYENDWSGVIDQVHFRLMKQFKNNGFSSVKFQERIIPPKIKSSPDKINKIYLGLSRASNSGWGVCSKYLKKEMAKYLEVVDLNEINGTNTLSENNAVSLHALDVITLKSTFNFSCPINYGYTFNEFMLSEIAKENAKKYELIFAGSNWCKDLLNQSGIMNTEVLIQGIDTNIFFPQAIKKNPNLFVIFSGGKFELRKGQDLVLKAIGILQKKYENIVLLNSWFNYWPTSVMTMAKSKFINFKPVSGSWQDFMNEIYKINDIDASRVLTLPVVDNDKMRGIYLKADVGLFTNRCEAGTNLVLMEFMACGLPSIVSYNTGHKDIANESNSILLKTQNEFMLYDNENKPVANWYESDLDEIIASIEFAYENRDKIKQLGIKAGEDMKNYTWGNTAKTLMKKILKKEV